MVHYRRATTDAQPAIDYAERTTEIVAALEEHGWEAWGRARLADALVTLLR